MHIFANSDHVEQIRSEWICQGELVRNGADQTMTIDPCKPLEKAPPAACYLDIPYQSSVITANGENPFGVFCR